MKFALRYLFCSFALVACSSTGGTDSSPGPMTVSINSDYVLPGEADSIQLKVTQFGSRIFENTLALGSDGVTLPASLTLCPISECNNGTIAPGWVRIEPGTPVSVEAVLSRAGVTLGTLSATVTNTNAAKSVSLNFYKACQSKSCGADEICSSAGECIARTE